MIYTLSFVLLKEDLEGEMGMGGDKDKYVNLMQGR